MIPLEKPFYDLDGWGGNYTDDFGVDWVVTEEDGWSSAPSARTDMTDAERRDGADDAPTFEASRVITLSGTAIAPDWIEQNRAKDRLNGVAYRSRGLHRLVVTEHHATRYADVRRSGASKVADRPGFAFDFTLSLVAPDPRRYAVTETTLTTTLRGIAVDVGRSYPRRYPLVYPAATSTSPVVPYENVGTHDTGLRLKFTGGLDRPGVIDVGSGRTLQFGLRLAEGDVLDVDTLAQTVVLNGTASRRGSLISGSTWIMLNPGAGQIRLTGAPTGAGVPSLTVSFRSAWK